MRLLIITQYFWPEQFTINDVVDKIKKTHDVTVFTGKPNYPGGSFFKGYNFFNNTLDIYKRTQIIRCPVIPRFKSSKLNLIINYFSFVFFGTIYLVLLIFKKFDYIFVYQTSPIFSVIPAIIFSKIKKIPLIVWVQDLWPETLTGTYHVKSKFIYNITKFFCKKIYECADIIFSQSNSINKNLKKKFKSKKIFYLPNIIQNSIKPVINSSFRKEMKLDKSKNIMFAGNLGDAQNLEILIKLAVKFKKKKNFNFLLVGTGSKYKYLEEQINKLKLKNIILLGHQSIKKMSLYFSLADFMVITLKNKKIFWITVPNKLIAYMAAGKPIISLAKGETSSIVKKAKCGYYINKYSIKEISKVLERAIKTKKSKIKYFSLNSRKYYIRNYNQNLFYKKFIKGIKLYENSKANLLRYT